MNRLDREIDLNRIGTTLWRGKWSICLIALVFGGLAFLAITRLIAPTFEAEVTVALEPDTEQMTDLSSIVSGVSPEKPSLNTEIHIIRSRQLLERLIDNLDLLEDPEFNPSLSSPPLLSWGRFEQIVLGKAARSYTSEEQLSAAIDRILQRLSISNPRDSYVFQIRFRSSDPDKAAQIANTVADLYINDQLLVKEAEAQRTIDYLDERTAQLQQELGDAELAVKDFLASTELVSPETLAVKNRQVKELRDRIPELEQDAADLQATRDLLSDLTPENATAGIIDAIGLSGLSATFRDHLNDTATSSEFEREISIARSRTAVALDQAQTQIESLQQAVADLETEIRSESQDLLTLQQMEREAEATGELYGFFLNRLKEAEVQQGTQQPDARLLSLAFTPDEAVAPKVALLTVMALMFGGLVGAGLVLLREMRDQGVRSGEELAELSDLTLLGQVPLAPVRKRQAMPAFIAKRSASVFAESIRNLRTSILMTSKDNAPRVVLVTSSVPGEGKTTMCIALAANLAGLGGKVLLVETDIRRRTLSQYFDGTGHTTLVDAVRSDAPLEDRIQRHPDLGISILHGGQTDMNAADFFASDGFAAFLDRTRAEFDYVIMDAPPVLAVPDARIVGRHADAVIYACAWNQTGRGQVLAGLESFRSINIPVTGVVLTRIDTAKARRYGQGQYGTYYGAYSKGYYED